MKRFPASCIVLSVVWLLTSSDSAFAAQGPAAEAPTPPMGWNSFNSYGVYLHEEAAYANLEAMAKKLKPHGYEFFVIDNGWFGGRPGLDRRLQPDPRRRHSRYYRASE